MSAPKRRADSNGSVYFDAIKDRYIANLDFGVTPAGRRDRRTRVCKTKKAATAALYELRKLRDQTEDISDAPVLFSTVADEWLAKGMDRTLRASTKQSYEYLLRRFSMPAFASVEVQSITADDVDAWVEQILDQGLARQTAHRARQNLGAVLEYALRRGYVAHNAVSRSSTIRKPQEKGLEPPYSLAEARTLLVGVAGTDLSPILEVALRLGLRRGEILGLRWSDINFDTGYLSVRKSLTEVREPVSESRCRIDRKSVV